MIWLLAIAWNPANTGNSLGKAGKQIMQKGNNFREFPIPERGCNVNLGLLHQPKYLSSLHVVTAPSCGETKQYLTASQFQIVIKAVNRDSEYFITCYAF